MANENAIEQLSKLDAVLNDYEQSLGVPKHIVNDETEKYFNLTSEDIRNMTETECGEAAYLMQVRAYHIQHQYNIELSRVKFCESRIKLVIADEVEQYKTNNYTSYEERLMKAIRHNEVALKLERVRMNCQARVDRLSFLSKQIDRIAEALISQQVTKRKNNG